MTVENLARWTILPNWRETVSERLTWLSGVLTSPTGAEQRFGVRRTPRRSWEASFLGQDRDRAWMHNAISAAGAARWYVPVFTDTSRTAAEIPSGATTIPVATSGREFAVGGFVMLLRDALTAQVHQIASVGAASLTLTAPTDRIWPSNTVIAPAVVARMTEQPTVSRQTDRVSSARVRFEVDGPSPSAVADLGALYDGYPVLAVEPNIAEDVNVAYSRLLAEFSTEMSRRVIVDVSNRSFTTQQHRWLRRGREENDALRAYFYALQGRRVATWLPTFAADFDLVADASAASTTLTVGLCGFARFGGAAFGRDRILIERRDGTRITRRITGVSESSTNEVLTLDSALGIACAVADVKRISFMQLARLDQDSIEFVHYTDKMGAMSVNATFRTAGEFRNAAPYTPLPLTSPDEISGLCGLVCG